MSATKETKDWLTTAWQHAQKRFRPERNNLEEDIEYRAKFDEAYQKLLTQILEAIQTPSNPEKIDQKLFVMMCGFTHAGKTEVVNELTDSFPLAVISSRDIHDVINPLFPQLQDGNAPDGTGYKLRQVMTFDLRLQLLKKLAELKTNIVSDSANLKGRKRFLGRILPQLLGYKTVLVWVKCSDQEILKRIEAQPKEVHRVQMTNLYQKQKKPGNFQRPIPLEADILVVFESGQDSVPAKILPAIKGQK